MNEQNHTSYSTSSLLQGDIVKHMDKNDDVKEFNRKEFGIVRGDDTRLIEKNSPKITSNRASIPSQQAPNPPAQYIRVPRYDFF